MKKRGHQKEDDTRGYLVEEQRGVPHEMRPSSSSSPLPDPLLHNFYGNLGGWAEDLQLVVKRLDQGQ